jgi:hypothetical protein
MDGNLDAAVKLLMRQPGANAMALVPTPLGLTPPGWLQLHTLAIHGSEIQA